MHFAAQSLGSLLGVFAVVAALATLLYVLKLRRRPVPVAFSPIWKQVIGDRKASSLFSRLRRLLSLLLQLLLLLGLCLALGDPRLAPADRNARHLVVLMDASASMQARDVLPSRLAQAQRQVRQRLESLGSRDRVLIAQLDANVTPLSGMTGDVGELEKALEALEPTDSGADLARGLAFAEDVLRGRANPSVLLVSDGAFAEHDVQLLQSRGDLPLELASVGELGDNVAVTGLAVRRYPLDRSRYEVMLGLENAGTKEVEAEVELLGDGQVVHTLSLRLSPGESTSRFYANLGGARRTLEAVLHAPSGQDHLARDNRGYALLPERRRLRVLVVTPGNTYLEAALLLDELLDVRFVAPGEPLPDGRFDATIFDGVTAPFEARLGGTFYLNVPEGGGPVAHRRAIENFGFDRWKQEPPLLRWIAPENIQVVRGHALAARAGDVVVGASELGPLLVAGQRGSQRFVALGFDPRDSDLVLRVAWPLLVLNVIHHFAEEESDYLSSYRTGEVWQIPGFGAADAAWLRRDRGPTERVAVVSGSASYLGTRSGFYTVGLPGSERPLRQIAANLVDRNEMYVQPRDLPVAAAEPARAPETVGLRHPLWAYLLTAVMLLSSLEWLSYHRRVTV